MSSTRSNDARYLLENSEVQRAVQTLLQVFENFDLQFTRVEVKIVLPPKRLLEKHIGTLFGVVHFASEESG